MLQRLNEIKTPLTAVMSTLQKSDWLTIEDCVPVMKLLDLMTTVFSREKYVTLSSIRLLVRELQHYLNKTS
jgi:hypothetical protein